jgi:hypothetical protein
MAKVCFAHGLGWAGKMGDSMGLAVGAAVLVNKGSFGENHSVLCAMTRRGLMWVDCDEGGVQEWNLRDLKDFAPLAWVLP